MDFIIKRKKQSYDSAPTIQYVGALYDIVLMEDNTIYIEKLAHLDYVESRNEMGLQIAMGDVIDYKNYLHDLSLCKGFYYLFSLKQGAGIEIQADSHSLLPLYSVNINEEDYASSSFMALTKYLNSKTENPHFYRDLALFYAPLGSATYLKEIKRLQYGEKIVWHTELSIVNTKRFYDYFVEYPISVKESTAILAENFIQNVQAYLQEPCAVVLTGGFDSRTLTACAHYYATDFLSFSYGRKGNGDVENPLFLAKKLGLDYHLVELEEEYARQQHYVSARESLLLSGGLSGFNSPHTLYGTKEMACYRPIHLVGYLGSEVFAAAKKGNDELISQVVIDYIENDENKLNYAYNIYETLQRLEIVNEQEDISKALERLQSYIQTIPVKFSKNQIFSSFMFENVLRAVFGVFIKNGMQYAKIRVPFVDDDFFVRLSRTKLSSFYRQFLENNLYKRMDGQRLYPAIIKRTWKELNSLASSKGYAPSDIDNGIGVYKMILSKLLNINPYKGKLIDNRSNIAGSIYYIQKETEINQDWKKLLENNLMINALVYWALSKHEFKKIIWRK